MSAKEERRDGHAASVKNLMRGAERALEDGNYGSCAALLKRAADAADRAGRLQYELDVAADQAALRLENADTRSKT